MESDSVANGRSQNDKVNSSEHTLFSSERDAAAAAEQIRNNQLVQDKFARLQII